MNWYDLIIVSVFSGFIRGLVKNPKTAASIDGLLLEIYTDLGIVLAGLGMSLPAAPAATPGA